MTRLRSAGTGLLVLAFSGRALAETGFLADVAPVLQRRCLECHREGKAKGRYRLDTFEGLMRPGSSGMAPVVAGDPAEGSWLHLITAADPDDRMPQDADPLPESERVVVERWITEGARFDGPDPGAVWVDQMAGVHAPPPVRYAVPVAVAALAFSPDGKELASGGYREVLVWGVDDGRLRRRLTPGPERIRALAWHPTAAVLAVAGGSPGRSGEVLLLDPSGGGPARTLRRSQDEVLAVAFSPDGSRLLAGGSDGALDLWSAPDGVLLRHLAHHADWIQDVAWSADGLRFASASRDRTARVLDAASGEPIASFTGHGVPVACLAFSADGHRIWSGGRDGVLRAWDAADSESRGRFDGGGEVLGIVVTPDRVVAVAADGRLRLYPAEGKTPAGVFETGADRLETVALAPDGLTLAVGASDGRVWVWRLGDAEPLRVWRAVPGENAP